MKYNLFTKRTSFFIVDKSNNISSNKQLLAVAKNNKSKHIEVELKTKNEVIFS